MTPARTHRIGILHVWADFDSVYLAEPIVSPVDLERIKSLDSSFSPCPAFMFRSIAYGDPSPRGNAETAFRRDTSVRPPELRHSNSNRSSPPCQLVGAW